MSRFLNFLIILFFLYSCSSKDNEKVSVISDGELEIQMIEAYKEGMRELEKGDVIYASKKFNEAELLYPQSAWASKSILMAAYGFYSQNYYDRSILELERFISKYPKHKNIDYAYFLLAMNYYETIVDEKKDLEPLLLSKEKFEYIIQNFPETDFAQDSKYKLGLIQDVLASKEMHIGKYYLKRKKWVAAINRFKTVISDYETTVYVEEALHRLVETYYKIGLTDEAEKYASVLGYNYQSSKWYEATYIIFNKEYETSLNTKKDKKSVLKKFKNIFK
ncbi:outer membrane protein assembly factor BamD [Candidatus Pelagibacter communis]|uniref:outer membrane protein assembly factor BamD n=1 Tax=Pelagibacter ubique TaxID=198252 RepID=UPI00094CB38F|nr:outer membrane protein assembly factor BamD [Candidatus Pelagibacter ubique]